MKYFIRTFGDLHRSKRAYDTKEECSKWLKKIVSLSKKTDICMEYSFSIFEIDDKELDCWEKIFIPSNEVLIPDEEEESIKKAIELARMEYRTCKDKVEKERLEKAFHKLKKISFSININE